jgi:hypothetical protein
MCLCGSVGSHQITYGWFALRGLFEPDKNVVREQERAGLYGCEQGPSPLLLMARGLSRLFYSTMVAQALMHNHSCSPVMILHGISVTGETPDWMGWSDNDYWGWTSHLAKPCVKLFLGHFVYIPNAQSVPPGCRLRIVFTLVVTLSLPMHSSISTLWSHG